MQETLGKIIVVFYYTQSGQALDLVRNICFPLKTAGHKVVYKKIETEGSYPFPWSFREFFEVFPETRLSQSPYKLKRIDLTDVPNADLVIISGQSWYLSPSLPLQAFFQDEEIKNYLKGKNIVNVSGCRNMWVMSQRKIRKYLFEAGGNYVGHIVLQDKAPNLVSVLTIVRWLFYNKKEKSRWLPAAGVSDKDLKESSRFGVILNQFLQTRNWSTLQADLMQAGAVEYIPNVVFVEKAGHRIFGVWAKFIKKKGNYQDKKRAFRVRLFCYYLFFVLYIISPFGLLVFYLTYPFRIFAIRKNKKEMCYELGWNENTMIQD